jgi:glycosyltransferase involved in cell wall biosynthesis
MGGDEGEPVDMSMQGYRAGSAEQGAAAELHERRHAPLRLAYLVSRFPKTTETFVVRELNEVAAHPDIEVELFSLFAPIEGAATVHPSAQEWVARLRRPGLGVSLGAMLRWTCRRPLRMATTIAMLVWGFGRTPRKLVGSLAAMVVGCRLAEEMRDDGIEHVHAHFVGNPATAAWVIKRLAEIEYSVTAHAYELYQDNEFLRTRVRAARFVVTISRFNADFLFRFCNGVTPPISVIRAGIVLNGFPFRERVLPAQGDIRALSVGSLIEHKGHRVLIEALSEPDPTLDRIHLTIVGDGPEREQLERAIAAAGLSGRVELVGNKTEDEVSALMAKADLFVLPSLIATSGRMEGIPVVLMEAMASGIPVVASRLSGIPELVVDGRTGTLAEQNSAADLREKLRSVVSDPQRAMMMARAARSRVVIEFDVKTSAARLASRFIAMRPAARRKDDPRRPAFIAWSRSGRPRELAFATGASYDVVYVGGPLSRMQLAPVRYLLSAVATTWFLVRRRPSVVVATNPPIFPALLAHLLSPLTGSDLILDSHPRGFGYKGSAVGQLMTPIHRYLMRHARATLVASPELAEIVTRSGGRPVIMHEAPPEWEIHTVPQVSAEPTVLWVTIFAADEPLDMVLAAARELDDVKFLITGDRRRAPREKIESAPPNVEFTGFWAAEGYARLIAQADVMLVLTTEPTSVPRAAFEAVEGLRPLVLSDLPGLREMFPAAVFVQASSQDIARGIREAIARHAELAERAPTVRDEQRRRWRRQKRELEDLLRRE